MMLSLFKIYTYFILALPGMLFFWFQPKENKRKIVMDLERNETVKRTSQKGSISWRFYKMFVLAQEFRSIYYMRIGKARRFINFLLPGVPLCGIGSTKSEFVGGGIYIQHGWSMVLDAESVGENLWINQNVTVGYIGDKHPRIGNNIRIGAGAVVLGGITIGDNVSIGANAIVVEDVPSDVTVCSPKAVIVRHHEPNEIPK